MSKFNKSYRIRTEIGKDKHININLDRDYDILEIMSLKINQQNAYKYHTSDYGVIVGRVLANGAFGIPNAKISVFIPIDAIDSNNPIKSALYPYNSTQTKNKDGVRYNLLPNEQVNNCHTIIGTFPEKQFALDNDVVLEVVDKYFKFTTRTNSSGDYMLFGVPVGIQNIHIDIDLSDIGILSQKPRDMVYKGYNITQFENPNKFKYDTNLSSLTQVISQDKTTDVIPFWGEDEGSSIGITRCDIEIQYKFEPTCVFMGSVVSDTGSNGFSRKCIPTPSMGAMDELTTGSGTIEMIRKTPNNEVEEYQVQGTQLINGDGIWCYQIPMNLDYMMTDEFGNMVPTNDVNKGIPTRTRVRFRLSMQDFDNDSVNVFRGKMLIPNNPNETEEVDYQFGTKTKEESYRDLFWNCVYSVKSYIPRIQKGDKWRGGKFTGFKRVNYYNDNNPIPYNNIRIRLPFMYVILCALIRAFFLCCSFINRFIRLYVTYIAGSRDSSVYTLLDGTLCDDNLENVCIIPGVNVKDDTENNKKVSLLGRTVVSFIKKIGKVSSAVNMGEDSNHYNTKDSKSIDNKNSKQSTGARVWVDDENIKYSGITITNDTNYLIQCVEMNLAQEYKVIQFDFYNDWINGLVYVPRWFRKITKKRTFFKGGKVINSKVKACNEGFKGTNINIVQQCGLEYNKNYEITTKYNGCNSSLNQCHKSKDVRLSEGILLNGGIVKSVKTLKGQYVYYFKPIDDNNKKIKLYSTDIILLGTLNSCDKWGIPNNLKEMISSTYQMPSNIALTDSDIEGDSYNSSFTKIGTFKGYDGDNLYGKTSASGDELTEWTPNGTYKSINKNNENGNYTELSGIDWGYNGPLQLNGVTEDALKNDTLYRPGGHFLGLSCVHSETTLKTCVNLSRICEYGVLMSQRQNLDILDDNGNFLNYAIVPSGLISKDEISDNNFRKIFATLNSNKLKTVINPKTGYPIYDFKYIAPSNFGGELRNKLSEKYNRVIGTVNKENVFGYGDNEQITTENTISVESEEEIIRTGEFKDDEYLKFRFGLTGGNNEITNKFLIKKQSNYSFPIYDNSYYFYFGLHDGKTAIDEFKKQYYAVCEKMDNLIQTEEPLQIDKINVIKRGLLENKNNGEIEIFYTIKDVSLINNVKYSCERVNTDETNGETFKISGTTTNSTTTNKSVKITGLDIGNYNIVLSDEDSNYVVKSFVSVKTCEIINVKVTTNNFTKNINNIDKEVIFNNNEYYNGYVEIDFNEITYLNRSGDTFSLNNGQIKSVILTNGDYDIELTTSDDKGFVTLKQGNTELGSKSISGNDNNFRIPLVSSGYTELSLIVYVDDNGDVTKGNDNTLTYSFKKIFTFDIGVESAIDIHYNDLPYQYFHGYENDKWWENNGFWNGITLPDNEYEKNKAMWLIKENLYQADKDVAHTIKLDAVFGAPPYNYDIKIVDSNGETGVTSISDITGYTIGIDKNSIIKYKVSDTNNNSCPENKYFSFPVIYRPFFGEFGLFYFNKKESNEIVKNLYLKGYVYNGKIWDKKEGFNDNQLNGYKFSILSLLDDDYIMTGETKLDYYYNNEKVTNLKVRVANLNWQITEFAPNISIINGNTLKLQIGSSHNENINEETINYSDMLIVNEMVNFYDFVITKGKDGDDTIFKISNKNSYEDFDIFLADESLYPLSNINNNNIMVPFMIDNLFNNLIKGNVIKSDDNKPLLVNRFEDETGNVVFNGETKMLYIKEEYKEIIGKYFLIAVSRTSDKPEVGKTVFKNISISNLYDYEENFIR